MDLTKSESLERVEKIFRKLNWPGFPGVQSLLLKVGSDCLFFNNLFMKSFIYFHYLSITNVYTILPV